MAAASRREVDDFDGRVAAAALSTSAAATPTHITNVDYTFTADGRSPNTGVAAGTGAAGAPASTSATAAAVGGGGFDEIPANAVLINVYDIVAGANSILYPLGLGVHHTGVEVLGVEYAFGRCSRGTGVFDLVPRSCPGHVFRESLFVGTTDLSQAQIDKVMEELSDAWQGASYHILKKNCNHFSAALIERIVNSASRSAPPTSHYLYAGGGVSDDSGAVDSTQFMKSSKSGKRRKLFPNWANRIARVALILPESLIAKIDDADKKAQGLA